MTTTNLIEVIREEMKQGGVTEYRLAQLSGVTRQTINNIIKGKSSPSIDNLQKICTAINLTIKLEKTPPT